MNTLDKINTHRLVNLIRKAITVLISNQLIIEDKEKLRLQTESTINSYMRTLPIQDHTIKSKFVFHDWVDLYPNRGQRWLARLAKYLRIPLHEHQQRWYHTILPYKIRYDYTEDDCSNPNVIYSAQLVIPHDVMECDLMFTPVKSLNCLTMNIIIDRNT